MKNNAIKVSVVMPNLNGMPYFKQAFDSVVNQSLREMEIIVVDAGSNDGSDDYVKEVAKKDNRVKLLYSQKKSMGAQYNLGIKHAAGQYIGFCESDDYAELNMFEFLYKKAMEYENPDTVKAGFYMFFSRNGKEIQISREAMPPNLKNEYNKVVNMDKLPDIFWRDTNIWNGIYNLDFLKKNDVLFNETLGAAFQDYSFAKIVDLLAEKQIYIKECFYHYRRDNDFSSVYKTNTSLFCLNEWEYLLNFMNQHEEIKNKFADFVLISGKDQFTGQYFKNRSQNGTLEFEERVEDLRKKAYDYYNSMPVELKAKARRTMNVFFEDLDLYRKHEEYQYRSCRKEFETAKEFLKNKKKIFIISAGEMGQSVAIFLLVNSYCGDVSFCDNNQALHNKELMGIKVESVENAVEKYKDAFYIMPGNFQYCGVLSKQLTEYGVDRRNIYTFPELSPHSCFEIEW